jgi:hypothetical protein
MAEVFFEYFYTAQHLPLLGLNGELLDGNYRGHPPYS